MWESASSISKVCGRQFSLAQQQKMYTGAGGRDSEDPAQRLHRPAVLARLGRIDVLVIDDWAMAPLNENERREVWEICEDRYQTRSTILTSQLPISRWHEQIGDPTIADGILDRLVHNAHRIEMRGESMRKKRNPPQDEKKE